MPSFRNNFRHFDQPLLIATGLLVLIGLAVIYSVSVSSGSMTLFYRQLGFAAVALVAFFIFAFYNYQNLSKWHRLAYVLINLGLLLVLIFGRDIRGSHRWIDLGIFNFQPAEFAKFVIIIGLARWLYLKRGQINSWKNILLSFLYVLIPAILILREPDLGSTIIVLGIWFGMILISPMKKQFILALVLAIVLVSGLSWKFLLHDYQRHRIEVFLDPGLDPRGRGYNVQQATIAVGSGFLFGRGFGRGLQSTLRFLPERQTDFIFAAVSEEVGFVGSMVLLALYAFLLYRLFRALRQTRDDFAMYLVGGVLCMFFGQILINIGMNMGIMPVTGITLPFLSAGGSSMVVMLASIGLVQNVVVQSKSLRF